MRLITHIRLFGLLIFAFALLAPVPHSFFTTAAFAGDKVKKVKPPKAKRRPNISYRPHVSRMTPKYPGRAGVLQIRDKRAMLFYGGEDGYFSEPVLQTISNSLYLEIKASRAFEQVKMIKGTTGQSLSRKDLKALSEQHQLDYVFIADLTTFNLLREKMRKSKKGLDFKINVRFGIFGQLIDARTGAVLWAESVEREEGQLNTDKRVSAEDYGPSAIHAVQNGFDDMKNSLRNLGLEVKK